MRFAKLHSLGNDFVLLRSEVAMGDLAKADVAALCDRHTGIGADGLVLLLPSNEAAFAMRIFNCDGSTAAMCGNGLRCAAHYAFRTRMTKKETFSIDTPAGICGVRIVSLDGDCASIQISLGPPKLLNREIPINRQDPNGTTIDHLFRIGSDRGVRLTAVNTGTPHAVVQVDDIHSDGLMELGRSIRWTTTVFPHGINVDFMQIEEGNRIKVRTLERGMEGETLSCGTGAAAVAATATILGCVDVRAPVEIRSPGGTCLAEVTGRGSLLEDIRLTACSKMVFRGVIGYDCSVAEEVAPIPHIGRAD